MKVQAFTTDLHEAAIAKYVGYETRWLPAEQQWVIQDPGDLDDLLADVRAGAQTISNAIAFLKVYDELRQIKFGERAQVARMPQPTVVVSQGKEYYTRDMVAAAGLVGAGYTILRADPPEGEWRYPRFYFGDDGNAMKIAKNVVTVVRGARDNAC
jgi:hypothetical protein